MTTFGVSTSSLAWILPILSLVMIKLNEDDAQEKSHFVLIEFAQEIKYMKINQTFQIHQRRLPNFLSCWKLDKISGIHALNINLSLNVFCIQANAFQAPFSPYFVQLKIRFLVNCEGSDVGYLSRRWNHRRPNLFEMLMKCVVEKLIELWVQ